MSYIGISLYTCILDFMFCYRNTNIKFNKLGKKYEYIEYIYLSNYLLLNEQKHLQQVKWTVYLFKIL